MGNAAAGDSLLFAGIYMSVFIVIIGIVFAIGSYLSKYMSLNMIFFGLASFILILFCLENICNKWLNSDDELDV